MIVKFFSTKKGGSTKALDYLLNDRVEEGTSRVLIGDPALTRSIINNITNKQKVTVGCLSFEEKDITEDLKFQLMKDFEEHLLPDMQDRYNILWVEHIDKGRLELNFVIPKINIQTGKSLQPYYHFCDLPRVEKWQDLTNIVNTFTSPKDPEKARTTYLDLKKESNKDYKSLDETLHSLVGSGDIKNRDQLISLIVDSGAEVTRIGKDYISVKLPKSKKAQRLKGSIYSEQFTDVEKFNDEIKRIERDIEQYNNRNIQTESRRLRTELDSYTQTKKDEYKRIHPKLESTRIFDSSRLYVGNDNNVNTKTNKSKSTGTTNKKQNNKSNRYERIHSVSGKRINLQQKNKHILLQNKIKGNTNDSNTTSSARRITEERETKYRAYSKAREARISIYKQASEDTNNVRERATEHCEYIHKLTRDIISKIGNIGTIITNIGNKIKNKIKGEQIKSSKVDSISEQGNDSNKKIRKAK